MANRDYKNIKRFVDNTSKEVEATMETGGSGKMYEISLYAHNGGSQINLKTFVDASKLSTYKDFAEYLVKKGYTSNANYCPIFGQISSAIIQGIYASKGKNPGPTDWYNLMVYKYDGSETMVNPADEEFSITYLEN